GSPFLLLNVTGVSKVFGEQWLNRHGSSSAFTFFRKSLIASSIAFLKKYISFSEIRTTGKHFKWPVSIIFVGATIAIAPQSVVYPINFLRSMVDFVINNLIIKVLHCLTVQRHQYTSALSVTYRRQNAVI